MREVSELLDELRILETDKERKRWYATLSPEERELIRYEVVCVMEKAKKFIGAFSTQFTLIFDQVWTAMQPLAEAMQEAGLFDLQEGSDG